MAYPAPCASGDLGRGGPTRRLPRSDRRTTVKTVTDTTADPKQTALEQLTAEHRRLDEQLKLLERRRALTPSEQIEMIRLKKQKLWTKDRIARLS